MCGLALLAGGRSAGDDVKRPQDRAVVEREVDRAQIVEEILRKRAQDPFHRANDRLDLNRLDRELRGDFRR